jgi:hypothetical protein
VLTGAAFLAIAGYVAAQSTAVLVLGFHPRHSVVGIVWTGVTCAVMLALVYGTRMEALHH